MGESRLDDLAQISIIMIFRLTQNSCGWTGQKKETSELDTLTNLRLSADEFSLRMPTIVA